MDKTDKKTKFPGLDYQKVMRTEEEFYMLPLKDIVIDEQVRSSIDEESEKFRALKESIRERGVLDPVLVRKVGREFHMVDGERRYRASKLLGIASIPARLLFGLEEKEVLDVQLIQSLQREDLNPLDEAAAYLKYTRARHGNKLDAGAFYNQLVSSQRDGNRVSEAFATTVVALEKISGKSVSTIRNLVSILRLPEEIQDAVRRRRLGLANAYVLAENHTHPRLMEIFEAALSTPMTQEALRRKFQEKASGQSKTATPYARIMGSVARIKKNVEKELPSLPERERKELKAVLEDLLALLGSAPGKGKK
jgi:ParB family chromosome partitioning protein